MPDLSSLLGGVLTFFGLSALLTSLISLYFTNKLKNINDRINKVAELGISDYVSRRDEIKIIISKVQEFEGSLEQIAAEAEKLTVEQTNYLIRISGVYDLKLANTLKVPHAEYIEEMDFEKKIIEYEDAHTKIESDSSKSLNEILEDWNILLKSIGPILVSIEDTERRLLDYFNFEIFKTVIFLTKGNDAEKLVSYGKTLSFFFSLWQSRISSIRDEGVKSIEFYKQFDYLDFTEKLEASKKHRDLMIKNYDNLTEKLESQKRKVGITRKDFYSVLSRMYQKY